MSTEYNWQRARLTHGRGRGRCRGGVGARRGGAGGGRAGLRQGGPRGGGWGRREGRAPTGRTRRGGCERRERRARAWAGAGRAGPAGEEGGRTRRAGRPRVDGCSWSCDPTLRAPRPRPVRRRHVGGAAGRLQLEHPGRVRRAEAAADLRRADGAQRAGHQPAEPAAGAGGVRPFLPLLRGRGRWEPGERRLWPSRGRGKRSRGCRAAGRGTSPGCSLRWENLHPATPSLRPLVPSGLSRSFAPGGSLTYIPKPTSTAFLGPRFLHLQNDGLDYSKDLLAFKSSTCGGRG